MKATLEFDLPEDSGAHLRAVHADNLAFVLWDLDQWFRDEIKYQDNHDMQPARDKLHEILDDRGIILDTLIE